MDLEAAGIIDFLEGTGEVFVTVLARALFFAGSVFLVTGIVAADFTVGGLDIVVIVGVADQA